MSTAQTLGLRNEIFVTLSLRFFELFVTFL
jgi:hypothetical protein